MRLDWVEYKVGRWVGPEAVIGPRDGTHQRGHSGVKGSISSLLLPLHDGDSESAPRFMSDIRLHTFPTSRNRNGYARLDPTDQPRPRETTTTATTPLVSVSRSGSPMPLRAVTVTAAASSSFTSARRKKGRRRDEYSDAEPEEEATLLGEGERDPEFLHDDGARPASAERAHNVTLQVRPRVSTCSSFD
jgi:hypothetical protein